MKKFIYIVCVILVLYAINSFFKKEASKISSKDEPKESSTSVNCSKGFDNTIALLDTMAKDKDLTLAKIGLYKELLTTAYDSTCKEISKEQIGKLSKLQVKELPKLRAKYCELTGDKLWENNIEISCSGKDNTVIEITGALFASNKNIKETYERLYETLNGLRFKKAKFKWYKGQSDFTYYTISEISDNFVFNSK